MSTLRANTLSDVAGTNSPDVTRGEFMRARFLLNGTGTIAALDSFGMASFTDNGVGDYTATFSNAFPNANWTGCVNAWAGALVMFNIAAQIAGSARLSCITISTGAAFDMGNAQVAFFGDKS